MRFIARAKQHYDNKITVKDQSISEELCFYLHCFKTLCFIVCHSSGYSIIISRTISDISLIIAWTSHLLAVQRYESSSSTESSSESERLTLSITLLILVYFSMEVLFKFFVMDVFILQTVIPWLPQLNQVIYIVQSFAHFSPSIITIVRWLIHETDEHLVFILYVLLIQYQ